MHTTRKYIVMKKCSSKFLVAVFAVMCFLLTGGVAFADVEINETNFPDEVFRNYLSTNFDFDHKGTLSDGEICNATELNVYDLGISSFKGIEYLTALEVLSCAGNKLTELDVSNNTALKTLICESTQLTSLVTQNPALETLLCGNNQLTALDLSQNVALTTLDCSNNSLTTLDVSQNFALEGMRCYNNQLTSLVTQNIDLKYLDCTNNQLTALDVSNNSTLETLYCENNPLTELDLSNNAALKSLNCNFTIESKDNNFEFNIANFLGSYTHLSDNLRSVDLSYSYTGGFESLELTPSQIAADNIVNFTIPAGTTLSHIFMMLKYSNSSKEIYVNVYPVYADSGSSSAAIAPIITTRSLPSASLDAAYSANLSAIGSSPITWTLTSGDFPGGLSFASAGTISGTPTESGAYSFTVTASNSAGTASKLFTILVPFSAVRSPKITTNLLNTGYTDSPYGFQLTASGTSPLTWSLASGSSLPDGLTLSTSGYLYGTPTSADTTTFTICAANSAGTASKDFTITVSEAPAKTSPTITPEDLHPAIHGEEYICQLVAFGTPPFTWTAKSKLPTGLSMSDSGLITGTPKKSKRTRFTFVVSNAYGQETKTLTLNVYTEPKITTKALKDAAVGKKYTNTIKSSGSKPFMWEVEGSLPQGISLFKADKVKITGTPQVNDSGMVRVTLSNPVGEVSKVFTLNVNAILPKISPKSLKAGKYGKEYTKAIKVKGTEPITLLLSGDLPEGLSFDSSTGKITGTPTEVCTDREITVIAYNIAGVASLDYSLTIKAIAPKITTKKIPDATTGQAYSASIEVTGTPEITFAATGLPAGLSINTSGEISGTPTESGKFKVTVTAANSAKTAKKKYTLKVADSTTNASSIAEVALPGGISLSAKGKLSSKSTATIPDGESMNAIQEYSTLENVGSVFAGEEYVVVAELPEVSVDVAGMYDFSVTLDEKAQAGEKLFWLANSSEPSQDDDIAEFFDEDGKEIKAVPENRKVNISAWLNAGKIYRPAIAVIH